MSEDNARRPLKVRELTIINNIASYLAKKNITPNQISITSVLFAFLATICLIAVGLGANIWFCWLAALFIQCRLLCNLFDGMVAMEGGKSTASGELFNDIPDRIADPLILVSAGYAITFCPYKFYLRYYAVSNDSKNNDIFKRNEIIGYDAYRIRFRICKHSL